MYPRPQLVEVAGFHHVIPDGSTGPNDTLVPCVVSASGMATNVSPALTIIGSVKSTQPPLPTVAVASKPSRSPVPGSIRKTDTRRPTATPSRWNRGMILSSTLKIRADRVQPITDSASFSSFQGAARRHDRYPENKGRSCSTDH